jgi:hypothetical protein
MKKAVMNPHTQIKRVQHSFALYLQKFMAGMLFLSLAVTAHAVPITGEVGFGGAFTAVDENWLQTDFDLATGIDFAPQTILVDNIIASGDFVDVNSTGTIKDFQFDPFVGPITDFWVIGTSSGEQFSFELTSVARSDTCSDNFLCLEGTGIISSSDSGLDDTFGTWIFTGNTTEFLGNFSWSAGSAAVTLPATAWIFITGLALIGFKQRLSKRH